MTMVPSRDELAMAQVFLLIISFSINSNIIKPFHPSLFFPLLPNTPVRL